MTYEEARDILMRWVGCHKSDHKSCLNCYDCEDCEYNLNDKELFDALDVAIEELELIEWMEERLPSMIRKSRELLKCWRDLE